MNNPAYAGAYAYGRVTHRAAAKPLAQMHQRKVRLPPQQWLADIWQAFPGYITQAQFEANQAQLASHRKHVAAKRTTAGWYGVVEWDLDLWTVRTAHDGGVQWQGAPAY